MNYSGVKYQYKLEVFRKEKKVYLCVYDRDDKLIESKVYCSFEYLEERLLTKLKYLTIINAWTNKIENWNYFKYYKIKIDFFKLKSFDEFLKLLEDGTIKIVFKVGIHLDEKIYGKTYDHGCGFSISDKDICKLYNKYNI